jgi:hypothetical protein
VPPPYTAGGCSDRTAEAHWRTLLRRELTLDGAGSTAEPIMHRNNELSRRVRAATRGVAVSSSVRTWKQGDVPTPVLLAPACRGWPGGGCRRSPDTVNTVRWVWPGSPARHTDALRSAAGRRPCSAGASQGRRAFAGTASGCISPAHRPRLHRGRCRRRARSTDRCRPRDGCSAGQGASARRRLSRCLLRGRASRAALHRCGPGLGRQAQDQSRGPLASQLSWCPWWPSNEMRLAAGASPRG